MALILFKPIFKNLYPKNIYFFFFWQTNMKAGVAAGFEDIFGISTFSLSGDVHKILCVPWGFKEKLQFFLKVKHFLAKN